jgi:integrase
MATDVAEALAALGQREHFTGPDDIVFVNTLGGHLDASKLVKRYRAALGRAGLRPLRFHDLRHTFGTRVIAKADIRRVQEWMGHADVQTTMAVPPLRAPRRGRRARWCSLRQRSAPARTGPRLSRWDCGRDVSEDVYATRE